MGAVRTRITPMSAVMEVIPLSPALGAQIRGVNVSHPLPEGVFQKIEKAWHEHLVIVLRGQEDALVLEQRVLERAWCTRLRGARGARRAGQEHQRRSAQAEQAQEERRR